MVRIIKPKKKKKMYLCKIRAGTKMSYIINCLIYELIWKLQIILPNQIISNDDNSRFATEGNDAYYKNDPAKYVLMS